MPLDGSGSRTRVNPSGCSAAAGKWSPDGSQIVIGSSCGVLVLDAATGNTIAHLPGSNDQYPTFAADGSKVFFSNGGSIYSYTLANASVATLADDAGVEPVPSPDGTAIAYRSNPDDSGQKLWIMNMDGTKRPELRAETPHLTDDVTSLTWSSDSSLVFAAINTTRNNSMTNNDIYAVDRTDHFRRTITATPDANENTISVGLVDRTADSRGSAFTAVSPTRVLDTRNGTGGAKAPLSAGAVRDVRVAGVAGVAGIPADATAVTVNLTATKPSVGTYLSLLPTPAATASAPTTSTLNIAAGQTLANGASIAVGANGSIRVYNRSGTVNAILDITGYSTG
jgi:hypothetical protein